jgi:hypothetical protein
MYFAFAKVFQRITGESRRWGRELAKEDTERYSWTGLWTEELTLARNVTKGGTNPLSKSIPTLSKTEDDISGTARLKSIIRSRALSQTQNGTT